jgi:hypothetical protein
MTSLLDDFTAQMSMAEFETTTLLLTDFADLWNKRNDRETDIPTERDLAEYWFLVGHFRAWAHMERILCSNE